MTNLRVRDINFERAQPQHTPLQVCGESTSILSVLYQELGVVGLRSRSAPIVNTSPSRDNNNYIYVKFY